MNKLRTLFVELRERIYQLSWDSRMARLGAVEEARHALRMRQITGGAV